MHASESHVSPHSCCLVAAALAKSAIGFLNVLHSSLGAEVADKAAQVQESYIQACMAELGASLDASSSPRMLRALSLLQTLLYESETKGTYGQRSHGARLRGPPIKLTVVNKIRNCNLPPGQSVMVFHGNSTVWDIRRQLGQRTGMSAEKVGGWGPRAAQPHVAPSRCSLTRCFAPLRGQIRMFRTNGELQERQNPRTLTELGIKDGSRVTCVKRPPPRTSTAKLLTHENDLSAQAVAVFTELFEQFSTDGRMTKQDCANFLNACNSGAGTATPEHQQVLQLFDNYATAGEDYISLPNFLHFYRTSCRVKEPVVWTNLLALGYRRDLKKVCWAVCWAAGGTRRRVCGIGSHRECGCMCRTSRPSPLRVRRRQLLTTQQPQSQHTRRCHVPC